MALERRWMPSPNNSGRGGGNVRLIVLHTAEGARTIESLGNFFASSSSGVSSHTGIDDKPGVIGEYVKRDRKAWTASGANPVAVQTELCAFASWDAAEWDRHPAMLQNTAQWIAEEAAAFGIPIRKLSAGEAQGSGRGVCQHNDLGSWGGGHWDCGPSFPIDRVIDMALGGAPAPGPGPSPEPATEDIMPLHIICGDQPEWWLTDLVTKRYIGSPEEADRIVVRTVSQGGKIEATQGEHWGPVKYEQADVDAIPTAK